jgi:CheY-like chemotaxis protein
MLRVHAHELHAHLPYLRRYARALTGDTDRGDVLVERAVEAALSAPEQFGLGGPSRAPLYALMNTLFDESGPGRPAPGSNPVEQALAELPEPMRRLYLLGTLEGLALEDAGRIVDLDPVAADALLTQARDRMRDRFRARILVVEDSAIIAEDLSQIITRMGHVVCGTAATERDALALTDSEHPTLALMDIQLAEGDDGVAIARKLRAAYDLPVIFVSAHTHQAREQGLDALGPSIAKPFTAEAIARAITRAVFTPRTAVAGQAA